MSTRWWFAFVCVALIADPIIGGSVAVAQDVDPFLGEEASEDPLAESPPLYVPEAEPSPVVDEPPDEPTDEEDEWGYELGPMRIMPGAAVKPIFQSRFNNLWTQGDPPSTHNVNLRVRLQADVRWDVFRVFVQLQDVRIWGAAPTTGIHQGFAEVRSELGYIRLGRQEFELGRGRFVGNANFNPNARAFDSLRLHGDFGDADVDIFAAWIQAQDVTTGQNTPGNFLFAASFILPVAPLFKLEPYLLMRKDTRAGDTEADSRGIASVHLRATGADAGLDYEAEFIFQFGSWWGGADHLAFGGALEVGYTLDADITPRIALGASYGSGQGENIDEINTFYPRLHRIGGLADMWGQRNGTEVYLRASIAPKGTNFSMFFATHVFVLDEPGARWSNFNGRVAWQLPTNEDSFAGLEFDLAAKWKANKWFSLAGGYALFLQGAAANNLVDAGLMREGANHWVYLQVLLKTPQ